MDRRTATSATAAEPRKHAAMVADELTGDPLPIVDKESLETGVGWAPEPFVPPLTRSAGAVSFISCFC